MNTPPTILLIVNNGQVGRELQRTIVPPGDVIAVGREEMDLAEPDSIRRVIREIKLVLFINAATYTALAKAKEELEFALTVNGIAPRIIVEEANRIGGAIVHCSTDCKFDGTKNTPYTEEDTSNPINVYSKTKHAQEEAIWAIGGEHLILWTSWVYSLRGEDFLNTILQFRQERNEHRVTEDQNGSSTWSRIIAETTAQAPAQLRLPARGAWTEDVSGICNLIAHGATSWLGFAAAIVAAGFRDGKVRPTLTPIGTTEYPTPRARPKNSRLSVNRLDMSFGIKVSEWSQSVQLCIQELEQQAGVTV